jgi:hypothetical protein
LVVPGPLVMPPIWEITHEINLIDLNIRLVYHLPRCPDILHPENWEVHQSGLVGMSKYSSCPMLCVCKKDNQLCTVINTRKHNENTVKDVTLSWPGHHLQWCCLSKVSYETWYLQCIRADSH